MNGSIAKCPICGKTGKIIKSNNPIVPGVCLNCLNDQIDYNNLKQANFFCRTYNLPWLPDRWIEIAQDAKFDTFYYYTEVISNEYSNTLYTGDATDDKWDQMNKEWQKCLTHQSLLEKIKPIKEDFIQRMQIKWGQTGIFRDPYRDCQNTCRNRREQIYRQSGHTTKYRHSGKRHFPQKLPGVRRNWKRTPQYRGILPKALFFHLRDGAFRLSEYYLNR